MPTQALTPVRLQEPPCETFTTFNFTICVQRHNLSETCVWLQQKYYMPAHVCYKSKKGTHLFQYQIKLIRDSKSVQTNCVRVRHIVLDHTETDTKRSKFIVKKLQYIWSICNLCRSAQSCLF